MGSTNQVFSALQAITPKAFLGLSLSPVRPVLPSPPLLSQTRDADLLSQARDLCCCQHGHMPALADTAARRDPPCNRGYLIGDGNADDACGLLTEQSDKARIDRVRFLLGIPGQHCCAYNQESAQITVAHLGNAAQTSLALPLGQPHPGGELAS